MKACSKCKQSQPFENFNKNCRTIDGFQPRCRTCDKEYRELNKVKGAIDVPETMVCTKCNLEFPAQKFAVNKNYPGHRDYWCHTCRRAYSKAHYHKNIDKHRAQTNKKRKARIDWLQSLKKDIPCKDCGKIYEPWCMDFDHVVGDKIDSVTKMALHNSPKILVLDEIKKCELVCALCHNRRTYERQPNKGRKYNKNTERNIAVINGYKGSTPCAICGKLYEIYNMQFDHLSPDCKYKNVSQLKNHKLETLLNELKKCQVLCAICHREKSIKEQKEGFYSKKEDLLIRPVKVKPFIDNEIMVKECTCCHERLPFDCFCKHKKSQNGVSNWCKSCFNAYRRKRREPHVGIMGISINSI